MVPQSLAKGFLGEYSSVQDLVLVSILNFLTFIPNIP